MAETRRRFDEDFRQGAVRIVRETGKPIAQVARDLGITRARWATGAPGTAAAGTAPGVRSVKMSGQSWCGCGGRMRSWRCSVMCPNAPWPSG